MERRALVLEKVAQGQNCETLDERCFLVTMELHALMFLGWAWV
jgi:hypothetical protein